MRVWQPAAVLGILAVVVVAGCANQASSANPQRDPAMRVASSVLMLERTILPVTKDQAGRLLPLFRALRGTPATDHSAAVALAGRIDEILTDAQRAELKRVRAQGPGDPGAPSGGAPGPGGSGPGGPGNPGGPPVVFGPGGPGQRAAGPPTPEQMAAVRGRVLDRAIVLLETRVQ